MYRSHGAGRLVRVEKSPLESNLLLAPQPLDQFKRLEFHSTVQKSGLLQLSAQRLQLRCVFREVSRRTERHGRFIDRENTYPLTNAAADYITTAPDLFIGQMAFAAREFSVWWSRECRSAAV